jgi:5-methylcytosine-specific restriction endonuclease McrA
MLTDAVLKNAAFQTGCVRNNASSENEKKSTYKWYHAQRPRNNVHLAQTCELDHIVPLYLGGADTLDLAAVWS